ncbi:MAG: glycosyltransferase family 4 protein [Oculatellaceae cyanobacterium Prado106]|jgi:glycosyltransferase involved in cell wall biosynthesis|nr:glycosyltransferase family 4 protein [Oculatellaceae cyanobacterium Prado106]
MPFPSSDPQWQQVCMFLQDQAEPTTPILAPNDFLTPFPRTYPYPVSYHQLELTQIDYAVFHKGMVLEINPFLAQEILQQFHPVFWNQVFIVYAKNPIPNLPEVPDSELGELVKQVNQQFKRWQPPIGTGALVVSTADRPQNLARSLPQLAALGLPILVIDNASTVDHAAQNQQLVDPLTAEHAVTLLRLPTVRSQPALLNIGINYWLADPEISWISYFQDNVDVKPDTWKILQAIQHPRSRPLLAGWDDDQHETLQEETIADHPVVLKRSLSGLHLHAHRDYWASVLPIPTPDPRSMRPGQGTDEDWWITAWAPHSMAKRDGFVVCIPGLVTPFDTANVNAAEQPLTMPVRQQMAIAQPNTTAPSSTAAQPAASSDLSLEGIKVLVDGYNLQLNKGTGIKTYGVSLIQALRQLDADVDVLLGRGGYKANEILDEIYFFDDADKNQNLMVLLKGLLKTASGPFYRAKRRKTSKGYVVKRGKFTDDFLQYSTSFNLPQCYDIANVLYKKLNISTQVSISEKLDIWHATYPLPMRIRGTQKITTIHDLIPLRLPYATLDNKENFYFKVRDALKESKVTITVSEQSKQDLLTYFDVDPDRIIVTYQPIALPPRYASKQELAFFLSRYGLEYQNYLLFVGAIEPKKNVGRLLDAYATLDTDMPLVIVGKKGWLWEDEIGRMAYLFNEPGSRKAVRLLEYVGTDSLCLLYQGAYCLTFPSLYEGFGLPPVEAMNFGCPVVTSNVSCLPEVCGDAALYVDPYDVRDIKQKLEKILGDRQLRDDLAIAGHRVADSYSMANYLKRLHQAYRQALS